MECVSDRAAQSPKEVSVCFQPGEFELWVRYLEIAQKLRDKKRTAIAIEKLSAGLASAPTTSLLALARATQTLEDKGVFSNVLFEIFAKETIPEGLALQVMRWACKELDFDAIQQVKNRLSDLVSASGQSAFLVQATRMVSGPEPSFAIARRLYHETHTPKEAEQLALAAFEVARVKLAARYLRFCIRRWPNALALKRRLIRIYLEAGDTRNAHCLLEQTSQALTAEQSTQHELAISMQDGDHVKSALLHNHLLELGGPYSRSNKALQTTILQGDLHRATSVLANVSQEDRSHIRSTFVGSLFNELEIYRKSDSPSAGDAALFLQPAVEVIRQWSLTRPPLNPAASKSSTKLVRHVFQYWDNTSVPDGLAQVMATWSQIPGWSYRRFDRKSAMSWLREHYGRDHVRAFVMARGATEQSDFFRICVLDALGGIYVDADDYLTGSPEKLLSGKPGAVLFREDVDTICNNFLYAPPQNPVFSLARKMAFQALIRRDNDNVWSKTGPGLLTRAAASVIDDLGEDATKVLTILPPCALKQHVRQHMKIPYKLTSVYWNQKNTGRSTVIKETWEKIAASKTRTLSP